LSAFDNAFVERVIRTLKKEEIWMNQYDSFEEAHEAVDWLMKPSIPLFVFLIARGFMHR